MSSAEALIEVPTDVRGEQAPRGVYLTSKANSEFSEVPAGRAELLRGFMLRWAWAKTPDEEPRKKKFKRLSGNHPTKRDRPPKTVKLCEFKADTTRVYGHETDIGTRPSIVLVLAVLNDKGGAAGKKQDRSIATAAQRAGDLYE